MLTRSFGAAGETLPVIGLGTYRAFDVSSSEGNLAQCAEVVASLVDAGGSVVDSSPMYGRAQAVVGDVHARLGLRDRLFLATKVWTSGKAAGIRQMEDAFRLMRTATVDLMQIHNLVDVATHTATLLGWKQDGRVRYIGITHYHAGAHAELARLVESGRYDFVQVNYSIEERQAEQRLLPLALEHGVGVIANRPFAQSALFSRVRGKPLPALAAALGCESWAQFFLKFVISHPAVTCVIPATRSAAHLRSNALAATGPLPDADMRRRMVDCFEGL